MAEAQLQIEHYWAGALRRAVIDGDVESGIGHGRPVGRNGQARRAGRRDHPRTGRRSCRRAGIARLGRTEADPQGRRHRPREAVVDRPRRPGDRRRAIAPAAREEGHRHPAAIGQRDEADIAGVARQRAGLVFDREPRPAAAPASGSCRSGSGSSRRAGRNGFPAGATCRCRSGSTARPSPAACSNSRTSHKSRWAAQQLRDVAVDPEPGDALLRRASSAASSGRRGRASAHPSRNCRCGSSSLRSASGPSGRRSGHRASGGHARPAPDNWPRPRS